jgi:hypothetical protein
MIGTGIIASARRRASWSTGKAIAFNGVDELAYIDDAGFCDDSAGAWAFDLYVPSLPGGEYYYQALYMSTDNTTAGNNFAIAIQAAISAWGDTTPRFVWQGWNTSMNDWARLAATTTLPSAATWYRVVVQSGREIYINGTAQTLVKHSHNVDMLSTTWMGSNLATTHRTLAIGGRRATDGTMTLQSPLRIDNLMYITRPLTAAEATEDYNGGVPFAPSARSFYSDIANVWLFENDLADGKGSNNFTGVNLDSSNYV